MPTIQTHLRDAFRTAIREVYSTDADPLLVPTQNENFGDYQCNAAMALAKQLKLKPRDVAERIKATVQLQGVVDKLEIAGPGFINIYLSSAWVAQKLSALATDPRLGVETKPDPQTVVVDYSAPNIAKEMHVGHLRSTIIGDAIARVLAFLGEKVILQNHLGDWGTQFGMLIAYVLDADRGARDGGITEIWSEDTPDDVSSYFVDIADLEQFYRAAKQRYDSDAEFAEKARRAVVALQGGNRLALRVWAQIVESTRQHFQPLYERMGVLLKPEHERGESTYNPLLRGVVDALKASGLAIESDGAIGVFIDGEKKPPLIIEKTGGGFLYGTTDLAAIQYRISDLKANRSIYFTDSRQAQHFSQVFRTADKAGWTKGASFEHAPFGTVLGKDNKPFKTRSGDTVKLKDLLDEAEQRALAIVNAKNADLPDAQKQAIAHAIGIGAVKYGDLSKDRTSDYVFDWDTMLAMEGNTAPYLQYAHARIQSIFRKSGVTASNATNIGIEAPQELALAKHILRLGEVLDNVARDLKPHLLCTYLYDLATRFSAFYENCPVLKSDEPVRSQRLALCAITARTLALGLDLLGIEHPEQM